MRVSLSANDLCVSEGFVTIAKEEPIDVMGASPLSDVIEILPARLTSLSLAAGLVGIAPPRLHDTPVEPLEREVAAARRRELRAAGEAAASQAAADADPGALRRRLQEEVAAAGARAEAAAADAVEQLAAELAAVKVLRERETEQRRAAESKAAAEMRAAAQAAEAAQAKAKAKAEADEAAAAEAERKEAEEKAATEKKEGGADIAPPPPVPSPPPVVAPSTPAPAPPQQQPPTPQQPPTQQQQQQQPAPPQAPPPQTSVAQLAAEWEQSCAFVREYEAAKPRGELGAACRHVALLVGQTSRVRYVVWEKAEAVVGALNALQARGGEAALAAGCSAFAAKLLAQGSAVVEKAPAMAYPLAMLATSVGARCPALTQHLRAHFCAACCYVTPHYVRRPAGATDDAWREAMGYQRRARGFEPKEQYYNRMAGYLTLWAALLQAEAVPIYDERTEQMRMEPHANPAGAAEAWRWLARLANQKAQRITPTLLLAFLKPSAHMLARRYPRQTEKLLRFLATDYLLSVESLLAASSGASGAEERAALAVLSSWLKETREALRCGRLKPPADAVEMPDFLIPDDTREAGEGGGW